jgi:CRP-like cAMP-binding protein
LTIGAHFGEIALIKNVKRTLSVRATSENLRLLVLSKEAFERILGSIKDYLKEDYRDGQEFLDTSFESEGKKNEGKAIETDELVQI